MYVWIAPVRFPTYAPIKRQQLVVNKEDYSTDIGELAFATPLIVAVFWLVVFATIYALWLLFIKGYIKWKHTYGLKRRTNLHKN